MKEEKRHTSHTTSKRLTTWWAPTHLFMTENFLRATYLIHRRPVSAWVTFMTCVREWKIQKERWKTTSEGVQNRVPGTWNTGIGTGWKRCNSLVFHSFVLFRLGVFRFGRIRLVRLPFPVRHKAARGEKAGCVAVTRVFDQAVHCRSENSSYFVVFITNFYTR